MTTATRPYGLTCRELEVTERVVRGLSNKQIAREFWLTEQTIKFHVSHTFAKVGVAGRHELIAKWIREQEMPGAMAGFVQHLYDVVDPGCPDAPPSPDLLAAAVDYLAARAPA